MVYTYDNVDYADFFGNCCLFPSWKTGNSLVQNKKFQIPSSEFKKKKYAKLEIGYAVDKEIVELLIKEHLAGKQDFLEVHTKKGNLVCYQIHPQNKITGFAKDNSFRLFDKCHHCGLELYEYENEPFYISDETLSKLKGLNQIDEMLEHKTEDENPITNNDSPRLLVPWYIVNKDVYNLLTDKYPKMQFIPVFQNKI